jgi:WD40 repeat protein
MWAEGGGTDCGLGTFSALAFSWDGSLVAAGTTAGWVYLYQVAPSFAELKKSPVHKRGINCVVFSKAEPNGPRRHDTRSRFVLTCSDDRTAVLLGVPGLSRVRSYCGAIGGLLTCDISAYGDQIIAAGVDTILHLWAVTSPRHLLFSAAHTDVVTSVCFSADGDFVLTSSLDGLCRIWATQRLVLLKTCLWPGVDHVTCSAFIPSERGFLVASPDDTIRIVQMRDAEVVGQCLGHTNGKCPTSIHFSVRQPADGERFVEIIAPAADGSVMCWDFSTQRPLWHQTVGSPGIVKLALSPDGQVMAASCVADRSLRIWMRQ